MSPKEKVIIGSRASKLATRQVEEVLMLLSRKGIRLETEHRTFATQGDLDKVTPLTASPGDDFFTDSLDKALINNQIDIAVHSAKDLPQILNDNLDIFALTSSLDETDSFVGKKKLALLSAGAKIGTSSLIRQAALSSINPQLKTVEIRGTIEERLDSIKQGKLDGVIVATCALKRLGLDHLITEIMPWEATPLQGQLAVVGRKNDEELKEKIGAIDVRKSYGPVILVGAGPGDPELITLKGIQALSQADCVFYDYLIDKQLLEHALRAEKIFVGKRKGEHSLPQSELSKMLRQKAQQGKKVIRLKSGDPLIFGRGGEEISYLKSYHIEVAVIPGVSSATGIPSGLGIPLTARGISSSVAFLSGYAEDEKSTEPLPVSIPKVDTIVFLMGLTKLSMILKSLHNSGWNDKTPIMVISKGTTKDEKIVSGTLQDIEQKVANGQIVPPALIVVGQIVRFAQGNQKRAVQKDTASSENILYLGTNPEKYRSLGKIVHVPMIEISPVHHSREKIESLLKDLPGYDLFLFTSRFGVKYFFELLKKEHYGIDAVALKDSAVIGQDTAAELKRMGISPKLISKIETSEGLLEDLQKNFKLAKKKILFPRSALPNPFLKNELTRLGCEITEFIVYENSKPQKEDVELEQIKKVLFTSPSTVRNFLINYGVIPNSWQILSKGPHTSQALKDAGYESEVLIYD